MAVPDGLVVPVIKKAQDLSLHGLNQAINDLAARARSKRLRPEDLEGGTFTVDNTGWTGSILTLPIINVPEVAIVTMEKIVKRPVVLEDQGDAIAIRSMMNMCIAIDHRATDGAQAGEFLADVRALARVGRRAHADLVSRWPESCPSSSLPARPWPRTRPRSRPLTIAMGGSVDTAGLHGPEARRHPDWIRARLPSGANYEELKRLVRTPDAQHRLRGGALPQHRGVLGAAHGHGHDPRRHVHARLRLLRREDRPTRAGSTTTSRVGSPRPSASWGSSTSS